MLILIRIVSRIIVILDGISSSGSVYLSQRRLLLNLLRLILLLRLTWRWRSWLLLTSQLWKLHSLNWLREHFLIFISKAWKSFTISQINRISYLFVTVVGTFSNRIFTVWNIRTFFSLIVHVIILVATLCVSGLIITVQTVHVIARSAALHVEFEVVSFRIIVFLRHNSIHTVFITERIVRIGCTICMLEICRVWSHFLLLSVDCERLLLLLILGRAKRLLQITSVRRLIALQVIIARIRRGNAIWFKRFLRILWEDLLVFLSLLRSVGVIWKKSFMRWCEVIVFFNWVIRTSNWFTFYAEFKPGVVLLLLAVIWTFVHFYWILVCLGGYKGNIF